MLNRWKLFKSKKNEQHNNPEMATLVRIPPARLAAGGQTTNTPPPRRVTHAPPPSLNDNYASSSRSQRLPATRGRQLPSNARRSQSRTRRSSSVHSIRSSRSVRSGRSIISIKSGYSGITRVTLPLSIARECNVCSRDFHGQTCKWCSTTYVTEPRSKGPSERVDLTLIDDLKASNEFALLEMVVQQIFSDVWLVTGSFFKEESSSIDVDAILNLYKQLGSMVSTCPMRGVMQGAQSVLGQRVYGPLTDSELAYILIIMSCPVFGQCSMFTKLTGPMQKLGKYASLRARARMILETCTGLLAHASAESHKVAVKFFSRMPAEEFSELLDLLNAYVGHRLMFHLRNKSEVGHSIKTEWYSDDWRISSVVKVMAILFEANVTSPSLKVPLSNFYNTIVDHITCNADFDNWQQRKSNAVTNRRFCFCQYPFIMSVGVKTRIFECAVQREVNLAIQREMFLAIQKNPETQEIPSRTFTMRVRRSNLLLDSLHELATWHCSRRRALRVEFVDEPGIDAGGLKKEWFLLFFRLLSNPAVGVFKPDEVSNYCWFEKDADPKLCEVAGVALGLALFNSVTLDVALPPLLFKILLGTPYCMNDLRIAWPELTQGLQAILDFEGSDFEEVFGLTFSSTDSRPEPLIPNGDNVPVTETNREQYVTKVAERVIGIDCEQLEGFKRGFNEVAGGNALTLFRPEEIYWLLRGDRQPLDVQALRSVTKYTKFGGRYDQSNREPVIEWFWDYFARIKPEEQGRLLMFITATDRIPATGIVNMQLRIICLGGDSERLPIAHTCFNQLGLYKYRSRTKLERKLKMAVSEGQGFGIK